MHRHKHVGVHEIAQLLGVTRQRVHTLAKTYPDFPTPADTLKAATIWHEQDIAAWLERHPQRPTGRNLPADT